MSHDATVNAGDIARLGNVGRAAVSNWRRRHDDFPKPIAGTASNPQFSLTDVENWLRRNGKTFEVSLDERAWQYLRASVDDLHLGNLVAGSGVFLLRDLPADSAETAHSCAEPSDLELRGLLKKLATQLGHAAAFELLCDRYFEAHARRLFVTPTALAAMMARLVHAEGRAVLDPACGSGELLLAAQCAQVIGQEVDPVMATIAEVRLRLRGAKASVAAADSLRDDQFANQIVDAVVCAPPSRDRNWGYTELTGDVRWEHGLPARGESELAWLQHCLAHVGEGGLVAILLPAAAANRRSGRRIRASLLRSGTLRAVVTIHETGSDLWLLRRPQHDETPASEIMLLEADRGLIGIETAWREHMTGATPRQHAARVIDLLDDDVDLSPARHRARQHGPDIGPQFDAALHEFRAISIPEPHLDVLDVRRQLPVTTIGELIKAGLLSLKHAAIRLPIDDGELPVLTFDDLANGREPSGRTSAEPGLIHIEPGDVVAAPAGFARVIRTSGLVLGPYLTRYRLDPNRIDPDFLAGVLSTAQSRPHGSTNRLDARRKQVPRLPLADQRRYGEAFRRLVSLEDQLRETSRVGKELVRLSFAGLIDGHLYPQE